VIKSDLKRFPETRFDAFVCVMQAAVIVLLFLAQAKPNTGKNACTTGVTQ